MSEEEADRLVFSRDSKFVEVTALLEKFDLRKHATKVSDQLESVLLGEAELDER